MFEGEHFSYTPQPAGAMKRQGRAADARQEKKRKQAVKKK